MTSSPLSPFQRQHTKTQISILPATAVDIPVLSRISELAFGNDTHTQLNNIVKDTSFGMSPALESWMALPKERCAVVKAVISKADEAKGEEGEGEIVGWTCWAFKGFEVDESENPNVAKRVKGMEGPTDTTTEPQHDDGDSLRLSEQREKETDAESKAQIHSHNQTISELLSQPSPSLRPIQQLNGLTSASMSFWQAHLTPPGAKCVVLIATAVHPAYQSRGIGSSLIAYGTGIADSHDGVYAWVSSSDGGYRAFEKAGFREVGRLELGLDEFAFEEDEQGKRSTVRNANSEDGKWGAYVWRYMRREARCRQ